MKEEIKTSNEGTTRPRCPYGVWILCPTTPPFSCWKCPPGAKDDEGFLGGEVPELEDRSKL